jgi:hypothetical protein
MATKLAVLLYGNTPWFTNRKTLDDYQARYHPKRWLDPSWDYQLYDLPAMSGRQDWYLVFKNAKVKPDQSTCVIGSFTLLPEFGKR